MKEYEFSSKNVQDAIQKGLSELNLKQEDVDIKILSEGGLFSKAKILIITEEKEEIVETPKKEEKQVKVNKEPKKQIKKEESSVEEQQPKKKEKLKEEKNKEVTENKNEKQSIIFIKTLAEKLGVSLETKITKDEENNLFVDMHGEHAGSLIGYRGEGLSAIQYLANVIEQQTETKEERTRILLNIENYKEKREEALKSLAKRMAYKAIKTGRAQRLEPMNAYERRIIHAELTNSEVNTYSKGDEPRRYLVIEPKR